MKKIDILDIDSFDPLEEHSFYCNRFSQHLKTHHKAISTPHKHNFYLTVLFTKGSGIHEIDFKTYDIAPGTIFFLNPGQTHYWEPSADAEGVIFFHATDFIGASYHPRVSELPFFSSRHNTPALSIGDSHIRKIIEIFESILDEYEQQQWMKKVKITNLLNCLYIDLSRIYLQNSTQTDQPAIHNDRYIHQLEKLIDQHFTTIKSPSAYAEQLNITTRHLNRITQNALGISTSKMITDRVILEAKRLLVYNPNSLNQIAHQLGYEEYAYFSRIFKKETRITPSDFKKQYLSSSLR